MSSDAKWYFFMWKFVFVCGLFLWLLPSVPLYSVVSLINVRKIKAVMFKIFRPQDMGRI